MYFKERSEAYEHMDNPKMDKESYRKAYKDINRCNTLLGGTNITVNAVKKVIQKHPKKSYTIYDMGCGDGNMLRSIAKSLKNSNQQLNLVGIDLREDVLELAREASADYPSIQYKRQDILTLGREHQCDILLCTLTMHHFKDKEIAKFLNKFSELARLGTIINDLERSKLAYFLFKLFSIFFIKTTIAKDDGLISISKGFLKNDLYRMAKNLNHMKHSIEWKWAFRYLWIIEPLKTA